MGYLYKITNKVNNKAYIGVTIQHNYEARWRKHINSLNYKEGCPLLKKAMKKHGVDQFEFKILLICFDEDLVAYEKQYIEKYNTRVPNGYNILLGGQLGDGNVGFKHSPETIEKIKEKGKEFREKNPNYFETYREKHKKSIEHIDFSYVTKNSVKFQQAMEERRKRGNFMKKGTILSEETKKKISDGLKTYYKNNTINNKQNDAVRKALSKPIAQYTTENILIKEYRSIAEADRMSGVKKSNIQSVLLGKTQTAGGFIWKYLPKPTPSVTI